VGHIAVIDQEWREFCTLYQSFKSIAFVPRDEYLSDLNVNPFNASSSKLLPFEGFSAILV